MGRLVLSLILAASAIAAPTAASVGHRPVVKNAHAARAQYLVMLVLDGGRPDYFGLTHLPHIDALRTRGTQYTNVIDGILESETPSGHTTLATGSTPRNTGILGFNWAQNDNDYSLFSPAVVRSGAIEHIMENRRVPTIAGLYKARFRRAKVVALSGHKYYAVDPLGGPDADAILYFQVDARGRWAPTAIPGHLPPPSVLSHSGLVLPGNHLAYGQDDSLATKLALRAFSVMRQRLTLINEPEFDWPLGHVYGGSQKRSAVIALMRALDRDLGAIESAYRKAGILEKTLFVITSDHGMAPVTHFVPYDLITRAIAQAGTKPTSIAYNHSAYIWLHDSRKASQVARNLFRMHDPGVSAVYYLPASGRSRHYLRAGAHHLERGSEAANQYLLDTLMNGHQPDVVLFCRTDATTSSSASHWKADHGGPAWQSQHIPLILSGPGIRPGQVLRQPAQLTDVAPTVLAALGASSRGMEGKVLTEALTPSTTASQEHARAAEIRQLRPLVRALVAQDAYERRHVPHWQK